ncbi:MAG: dipeptide ABC transporter ATP-binding protein [Actinomycetota bacterium]
MSALLEVRDLVKEFPIKGDGLFQRVIDHVKAVSGLSFDIDAGETLGLVGESGSGKSTCGRAILRLHEPTSGSVKYDGREVTEMSSRDLQKLRQEIQIVFQDPYASLNPKLPVNDIVGEPLAIHRSDMSRADRKQRVADLLAGVGLQPEHGNRYPHEFSGGQRQRIGIARAIALDPKFIVLDEPVSALDVSVQAGVVNLLRDIQKERGIAYLFIAHDLSVVRHVSDRVAVMYLGKIVEIGERQALYRAPAHPYTRALMSAVPVADPDRERERERIMLQGDVPSPVNPPSGCRFRTRCWRATEICASEEPPLTEYSPGLMTACHHPVGPDEVITAAEVAAGMGAVDAPV